MEPNIWPTENKLEMTAAPEISPDSRKDRRRKERNAKALEDQLHLYVNKYFKFTGENRGDMEKQQTELLRLNQSWRAWVNRNHKTYNPKVASSMFITEIDRLLGVYNNLTPEQRAEIEK